MAPIKIATLNGADLPIQFSYRPYVPAKRNTVIATANAVVVQSSAQTQIVHGEGTIPWNIEAATPGEFQTLYDLYNTAALTLYTFVGYWGETLEIYFSELDQPQVSSTLFRVSGQFQVMCETVAISASSGCD